VWLFLLALLPSCGEMEQNGDSKAGSNSGVTTDMWGVHEKKAPPPTEAEVKAKEEEKARFRIVMRERILVVDNALDGRPEYLVTDASLVEPALDKAMELFDLRSPNEREERTIQRLVDAAMANYRSALHEPAGLKLQEQLIEKRFANPVITTVKRVAPNNEKERELIDKARGMMEKVLGTKSPPRATMPEGGVASVTADYGWVPAPLLYYSRRGVHQDSDKGMVRGHEAAAPVVARLFMEHIARHPEVSEITLIMKVKHASNGETKSYKYHRNFYADSISGVVQVYSPGLPTTYPLGEAKMENDDFSAFLDGRAVFLGRP
jgi:hypothetical protein